MTADQKIARLKIVLDDVEPKVERWIVVPLKIRLDRLHDVLQAAMGWTNSHLWEIRIRDLGWGPVDPDNLFGDGPLDARKTTLQRVLAQTGAKRFTYLYDFGDGWSHTVKLDRFETLPVGLDATFLAYAKGPCPPEDCGGPFGYADLVQAYTDPAHESHLDALDILGTRFNPIADPATDRYDAIQRLVGSWARKPRVSR
ncbi:MAG: plasmid pRiA4b ORF-3 family protein [Sneathiella sp.]|nr:plasmid pRiA4b ORF-3 family protein [Sneathiella sp.]